MNSILKKTLLAMSVAAAATANAAEITANGGVDSAFTGEEWPLVSAEGFAIAGEISIGTGANDIPVQLELESAYQETDLLLITITGATIADADSVDIGGTAFELLETTDTTLTLRPTQGSGGVAAGTYDVSGIVLEDASGAVTFASQGRTVQNITIDTATATPIAAFASEFGISAGTALNGVVDVEKERKEFTDGTTDAFTVDVEAGADLLAVTAGTVALSVTGSESLSFLLDEEGELAAASYELDGVTEDDDETTLEGNTLSLVSSDAYSAVDDAFGVTFTADGEDDEDAQQLVAQSFSADVTLTYSYGSTNGTTSAEGLAVGAWTLSGATVNIPFMPYGGGISQIIHLSNDGSVDGDIELTAFDDEGESYGPVTLNLTAAPGTVTRLNGAIATALTDEGFDGSGNVDITLVINSPAGDVEVFAAYNVRGDRISVPVQ